ncbi:Phytochrome-like protein cph2 [Planctomycetes bacterium CA13]|uniref:Phytochrome-like protein cph2 n=1 Tax=Novipirellula herctigrandis TaxID=2527986 RepID=A0A5C5Z2F5_9BACT|nr:Phytochrome-like protein cph2 [Planctomycetes bacterium CA13]
MHLIKELGVSISIDDFGTGYSSLSYLRQFPIDRLKIDREFIKDIPDADDGVIASSIIVLAKALDLKVLAEGVETKEQLEFIKTHDCDEYQGYFFSPPVEADEVTKYFCRDKGNVTASGKTRRMPLNPRRCGIDVQRWPRKHLLSLFFHWFIRDHWCVI